MDLDRTAIALRNTQSAFPAFDSLSLVDPSGQQLLSTTEGAFVNLGSEPHIQRALTGEPRVFGGVTRSVVTNEPIVVMAAPVRSPETDAVIGAVSASIRLPVVSAFLSETATAQQRDIIVIDLDGGVVASSDPEQMSAGTLLAGSPILVATHCTVALNAWRRRTYGTGVPVSGVAAGSITSGARTITR